jgi:cyclophilin family peptidyl-prolyl cis-trans isomerase
VVEGIRTNFGNDLRTVYRHFPLISIHDKALITAEAAEAAGAQDKFWEMHDLLYERQAEWAGLAEADILDTLVTYAADIEVEDIDQFRRDLENGTYTDVVMAQYNESTGAGLTGTPSFVVNELVYPTGQMGLSYEAISLFTKMVQLKATDDWQWYAQPEQVIDPEKEYIATIETEKGDIVIELYPATAPANVNSFAFLAEQNWYRGVTFHRVLPNFMAQSGDPTGLGFGFPGYRCDDEVSAEHSFDEAGVLALANSGPGTNGSQFFITYGPTPNLNPDFTILGKVLEGLDVVESITPRDPSIDPFAPPGDKIISIIVEEK